MKEMTTRAAQCDVCEEYKLCWHISLADVCASCLSTASDVISEVDNFGFIDASMETSKPKATAKNRTAR